MAYTGLYRSHRIFCSKRVWGYIGSTGGRVWDYVEGVSMHGSVKNSRFKYRNFDFLASTLNPKFLLVRFIYW